MTFLNSVLRVLSTLATLTGPIAGVAISFTIGYGLYGLCCRFDRDPDLRPGFKTDIVRFLKSRFDISLVVGHIGNWFALVFDHSHFSFRCIRNSILVTLIYFFFFGLRYYFTYFWDLQEMPVSRAQFVGNMSSIHTAMVQDLWNALPYIFLIAVVGDYISLGKGRVILRGLQPYATFFVLIQRVFLDILLSCALGVVIVVAAILVAGYMASHGFVKGLWVAVLGGRFAAAYEELTFIILRGGSTPAGPSPGDLMWAMLFTSTLTASLWTVSLVIAASTVNALNYLLGMTRWVFDVEKDPICVIGKVLGPFFGLVAMAIWFLLA